MPKIFCFDSRCPSHRCRYVHDGTPGLHSALRRRRRYASPSLIGLVVGVAACGGTISLISHDRPLHSDSKGNPRDWSSKHTVVHHNQSLPERGNFFDASAGGYVRHDADHSLPGQQSPPPQTKGHHEYSEQEVSAWRKVVDSVTAAKETVTNIDLSEAGSKIADYIVPRWAKVLPAFITKLQDELSMSPGSLAEEVWREANDPECNPEIVWDARVRISEDLCTEEQAFLQKRRVRTTAALARYLDVPESEVHPDDV